MIERCRQWEYSETCENKTSELVPIRSCGKAKIGNGISDAVELKEFGSEVTRIAISPLFPSLYIEDSCFKEEGQTELRFSSLKSAIPALPERSKGKLYSKQPAKCCSRCMNVAYCSRECQVKDWKKHKQTCLERS